MGFVPRFSRREDEGYDASYGKGSKKLEAVIQQSGGKWHVTEGFGAGKIPVSKKLGDVKDAWGARATAAYGTVDTPETATQIPAGPPKLSGPPSLRPKQQVDVSQIQPRKGPPSLKMAQGIEPTHFHATDEQTEDGNRKYEGSSFADLMKWMDQNPSVEKAQPGTATCPHCKRPFTGWKKEGEVYLPPCRCNMPNDDEYLPDCFDPRMFGMDNENRLRTITPIGVLDMVYAWMLRNREYVTTEGKLDPLWREVQRVLWTTTGYAEFRPERWEGNQP